MRGRSNQARPACARPPRPRRRPNGSIERLDDRERRLSLRRLRRAVCHRGADLPRGDHTNTHFRLAKGQLTPQTTLVLGIVFGVLLSVATLLGRRAPVGFVALFAFLSPRHPLLRRLPFLVLAVWLLYRSYKFQKEATAKCAMANGPPARRPPRPSTGAATRPPKAASRERLAPEGPGPPEANKRYTPERPPPPAPKPSRRERKAAQASD